MDTQGLYKIGEVARMFGTSAGSLRHYEQLGLVTPEYIDPESGYRYYSYRQFERLNTLRALRALDMPLESIADFLNDRDIDHILDLLARQRESVRRKQQELQRMERRIDRQTAAIRDALASRLDVIELRSVPAMRVACRAETLTPRTYLDLEVPLRRLLRGQTDTTLFLGKVGVGIGLPALLCRQYDVYDRVFVLPDADDDFTGETTVWPAAQCAVLRFCGSHRQAPPQYAKLAAWLDAQGLCPADASREVTLIDDMLTQDERRFVTEIQIPVREAP